MPLAFTQEDFLVYMCVCVWFQISAPVLDTSDMDPELARYLNRNFWEQKQDVKAEVSSTTQPSAPTAAADSKMSTGGAAAVKVQEVRIWDSVLMMLWYCMKLFVPAV